MLRIWQMLGDIKKSEFFLQILYERSWTISYHANRSRVISASSNGISLAVITDRQNCTGKNHFHSIEMISVRSCWLIAASSMHNFGVYYNSLSPIEMKVNWRNTRNTPTGKPSSHHQIKRISRVLHFQVARSLRKSKRVENPSCIIAWLSIDSWSWLSYDTYWRSHTIPCLPLSIACFIIVAWFIDPLDNDM